MRIENNNYAIAISFAGYFTYVIAIRDQLSNKNNSTIYYGRVGEGSRVISVGFVKFVKDRECQSVVQRMFLKILSTDYQIGVIKGSIVLNNHRT